MLLSKGVNKYTDHKPKAYRVQRESFILLPPPVANGRLPIRKACAYKTSQHSNSKKNVNSGLQPTKLTTSRRQRKTSATS